VADSVPWSVEKVYTFGEISSRGIHQSMCLVDEKAALGLGVQTSQDILSSPTHYDCVHVRAADSPQATVVRYLEVQVRFRAICFISAHRVLHASFHSASFCRFIKDQSRYRLISKLVNNLDHLQRCKQRAQKALVLKFWYLKFVSSIPARIDDGFVKKLYFNVWYSKFHLRSIRNTNLKRTMFSFWKKYIFVDLRVMYQKIHDHRNSAKVLVRYCFDLNKKYMWRCWKIWKRVVTSMRGGPGVLKERPGGSGRVGRSSRRAGGRTDYRFNSESFQELIKGIRSATAELDENQMVVDEHD
jgi:hypothetical protein